MGNNLRTYILLGCCLVVLLTPGCAEHPIREQGTDTSKGYAVTDFRGKELHFDAPVSRAVCLIESAFSGICMLKSQDKVVGIPSDVYKESLYFYYSRLDQRIKDRSLPSPGNWDFISIEQVVGLEPDLVIVWSSQTEAIASLERFGIPVYAVMLHSFEDVYKEMEDLGRMFGRSDRADSLVRHTRMALEENRRQHVAEDTVRVYFMWAQGINETSGKNSTVEQLLHYAGTSNACGLKQEHVTVSTEKIIDWDPGMIVMWHNERLDPADILQEPSLRGIQAVRNQRVHELPGVFCCDFWTLKMQYPVRLVSRWAYQLGTKPTDESGAGPGDMFQFLYGTDFKVDE